MKSWETPEEQTFSLQLTEQPRVCFNPRMLRYRCQFIHHRISFFCANKTGVRLEANKRWLHTFLRICSHRLGSSLPPRTQSVLTSTSCFPDQFVVNNYTKQSNEKESGCREVICFGQLHRQTKIRVRQRLKKVVFAPIVPSTLQHLVCHPACRRVTQSRGRVPCSAL